MSLNLSHAQDERRQRGEHLAQARIDSMVNRLVAEVELSNADRVGPAARKRLKGLLDFYRKKAHPFTACVRDNTKRFGHDDAEKVCAVLKDLEEGTTKWRNGGHHSVDVDHVESFSMDDDLRSLLLSICDTDYRTILGLEGTDDGKGK